MANQIIVTQSGNVQVSIEPTPNVQVQISRAAITTLTDVPTANYANFANVANIANVANSVAVANVSGIGNIATINLDGSASNVLYGNGVFAPGGGGGNTANANYANFAGTAFNVSGSNVTGTVANANYAAYAGNATIANSANSVSLANVSGAGNIASINLDGNVSNVLSGNGSFVALPTVSANANYANFAGTAFNVSGANVSGEVANANYATFAGTAYSVSGSNVVGEVSNANYATYSGTAGVANSVAVANVVGIGNIATTNYDGNGSNALLGNGTWGPVEVTSTTISNGTSNVNIPVANGNVNISTNNNANIAQFDTNGTLFLYPTTSPVNALRITSFGNPVSGDVSRIASSRARGNITTPLSVQGSDRLMRLLAFGHNGANYQTSSVGTFQAQVDGSYSPNTANIPIGWNMSVNDTSAGTNQSKVHNFYSNGNVQFAQGATFGNTLQDTVFKVIGNNVNGYAEFNGVSFRVFQDNSNGAAGYSPFYFTTYQGNNDPIPSSKFYRATGTASSPTAVSNGSNIALNQYAAYADSGNTYKPVFEQQVTVTSNDGAGNLTGNMNFYAYNTGSNINLQASNTYANIFTANYLKGDGSNITNVSLGNIANLNIVSSNTSLPTDQFNTAGIVVGSTANANLQANSLQVVVDYGNGQGDSNSALTKGITYVKARGTSASPTTAVANDIIKRENYLAYNATGNVLYSSVTANATTINANANAVWGSGSYQINTGSTTGDLGNANALSAYNSWNFFSTGQLQIQAGSNSAPGSLLQIVSYGQNTNLGQSQGITFSKARGNRDANASVQANDTLGRLTFQGHNGNAFVTNRLPIIRGVVDGTYTTGNANIPAGLQFNVCDSNTNYTHYFWANGATALSGNLSATGGNFSVSKTTANAISLYLGGDKTPNSSFNMFDAQFSVTMSNVDTTTGFSPFRFQQYAPTSSEFGPMYYYRARGNDFFTQAPVVANDKIMSYNFIVNSNNVTTSIGQFDSTVTYNDNAGNVGMKFDFNATGQGTTGYLNGRINLLANITDANNFQANNVTVSNGSNNFMKLSTYTEAALTAITGQVGWMAAVTDSGGGGNPNGMLAFWDTTNSRWSYIHDNSAV